MHLSQITWWWGWRWKAEAECGLSRCCIKSTLVSICSADRPEGSHPSLWHLPSAEAGCAWGLGVTHVLDLGPMASVNSESSWAVEIKSWLICLLFSLFLYQEIVAQTIKRRERREWEARR